MSHHSPEPWTISEYRTACDVSWDIHDAKGAALKDDICLECRVRNPLFNQPNLTRIVACVNACKGLPTEDLLVSGAILQQILTRFLVRKQRNNAIALPPPLPFRRAL